MQQRQYTGLSIEMARHTLANHELNFDKLTSDVGIAPTILSNPYQGVLANQDRRFFHSLLTQLPLPGLGLKVGRLPPRWQTSPIHLTMASATDSQHTVRLVGLCFRLFCLHLGFERRIEAGEAITVIAPEEVDPSLRQFWVERGLAMMVTGAHAVFGLQMTPSLVRLDYPKPAHFRLYEEVLQCPVLFDQDSLEIRYPYFPAGLPTQSQDARVNQSMVEVCRQIAADLEQISPLVNEIERLLTGRRGRFPDSNEIAAQLNLSPRSLRRKLAQSGFSYQELLDRARYQLSITLLSQPQLTIEQISEECGYKDSRSFCQAFKKWHGLPPSSVRPPAH